jgi:purine-nucleoside/S-methyl-5'-thioadenosine phosphorylase / adenosine deaminase
MMLMSDPQPNDAFTWTQEPWGRALRCTRLSAPHLFTSRDLVLRDPSSPSAQPRAISAGGDDREWTMVAGSLGVTADRLQLVKQVHGIHVVVARSGSAGGSPRPVGDIIVTDDPSVAIGVRVADCAPVLLHDPVKNVVGAVHAGWRGAAAGAATAAVRAMEKAFGSHPPDLVAAIGPCLGRCCGEVGPEVVDAFRAGGAGRRSIETWFTAGSDDRSYLDLERANRDQLAIAGLNPDFIFASGLCTKTHHDRLHSYRAAREGVGRMLGAIRIPGRSDG